MLAGRRDDRPPAAGRAGLRERDLAETAVELAGLVVGPDDVEREVLEHPHPDAVAGSGSSSWRSRTCWSSTGSAARANRSRWNARSTTVATHQPVIGSLRSSNRPAAIAVRPSRDERVEVRSRRPRAKIVRGRFDRRRASGWQLVGSPSSRAIEVEITPGIPHGSISSKSARSTVDVEGDPVVADAALDAQAEGADLARVRAVRVAPAAGMAVAPRPALTPSSAQVATRAASSARTSGRTSRPRAVRPMIGYATSWPGPW